MRGANLKVVESSRLPGMLSLRGPKGRGQNDGPHEHITAAGFKPGESVVLISRDAYEVLMDYAGFDPEEA